MGYRRSRVEAWIREHFPEWARVTGPEELRGLAKLAKIRGLYSVCYGHRDVEFMLWIHIQRMRMA